MEAEVEDVCHDPEPFNANSVNGVAFGFILMSVPPLPEPLPRTTIPLVLLLSVPETLNVPAASSTAPRNPFASGANAETALMADWIAEVSSPPDGLTVCFAATRSEERRVGKERSW